MHNLIAQKMKRKTVVIIIVIVVIILLAISSWLIYKKYFKKTTGDLEDDKNIDPNLYGGATPAGGGYTTPATFPLRKGMSGQAVADIQNAINKKCNKGLVPDGAFGPKTEAALNSCYGATTVSQALYTQMKLDSSGVPTGSGCPEGQYKIPGLGCVKTPTFGGSSSAPPSSTGFKPGDKIYGKTLGKMLLYKLPSSGSSIGEITIGTSSQCDNKNTVYVCSWLPIGTFLNDSTEGFSKIRITTKHYNGSGWSNGPADYYVYTSLIKK